VCLETLAEDNDVNDANFEQTMSHYYQKQFNVVPEIQQPLTTEAFVKSLEFSAVADRLNLSTRDMTVIAGTLGRVNNENFDEMALSWSSVYRIRSANRKKMAKAIEQEFVVQPDQIFTIHWDGKSMENITNDIIGDNNNNSENAANCGEHSGNGNNHEKCERLAICATEKDSEKLLGKQVEYLF
jgi:hypothetical protein